MSFDEARDSLHRDAMATMPMLESLSRTASAPTLRTSFGPSAFLVPGHPSAALLGPGLTEAELQTLILNESEPQWQPAAAHDIKSLPEVRIESKHLDDADTKTCSVCQEDFALGEMATLLPCGHLFHGKCIVQWLEKNRTCPLCRKEIVNVQAQLHSDSQTRQRQSNVHTIQRPAGGRPTYYAYQEPYASVQRSVSWPHQRLQTYPSERQGHQASYAPEPRGYQASAVPMYQRRYLSRGQY
uniref:RING-type domain-containing protein n=1 Tax=Eutreptiella gymnastica TaxID=73025 RepID=A0A7S4CEC3_9EUGL